MIDIKFNATCDKCFKTYDLEGIDANITCDECIDKNEIELGLELLKYIFREPENILDGEIYIGFESQKEKLVYMRGIRMGFTNACFRLQDYFGDELTDTFEKLSDELFEFEIDPKFEEPKKEDK